MTDLEVGSGSPQSQAEKSAVSFVEITDAHAGQRIDNFLITYLKGVPKSRVYRILRKGEVRVNKGRIKAEYRLCEGDLIRIPPIRVSEEKRPLGVSASLGKLIQASILFEDDRLLVVNKPSGLAVHGGSGISQGLIEVLRVMRPDARFLELVHRLDRDTSGCIMVAKKRSMLRFLHEQLRNGTIDKRYLALVAGRWPNRRKVVNAPLLKNTLQSGERMVHVSPEGKRSVTEFAVISRYQQATLVEAKPISGRTHQIRVHALHVGYPLLGDDKYGDQQACKLFKEKGLKRLFLHAASLKVPMPEEEKPLEVSAALSADLQSLLDSLVDESRC
ncbi:23S rRNA pseudouridine(955/2504/2580) synthase RluC [Oceanicoccus sp. KOV_DT_Chl]|uniref:23S rRNA pseudouridine(955/2504/2580) synthase RluC n=1 Tax=Oceanicoccus sp. KOV_DT_Chl TaxID=1904639 RepID=UPI000C795B28|nr:23S rRNA pseudouridine(955/2504/2580) synthase RluC [Oceanicoccus sp. KOV_DT_Chl]